jgi:exonuclease VII small subunit
MDEETKKHLDAMEMRLLERLERSETNLLKAFRKWAAPIDANLRVNKAYSLGFDDRLAALEERVNDLENEEK